MTHHHNPVRPALMMWFCDMSDSLVRGPADCSSVTHPPVKRADCSSHNIPSPSEGQQNIMKRTFHPVSGSENSPIHSLEWQQHTAIFHLSTGHGYLLQHGANTPPSSVLALDTAACSNRVLTRDGWHILQTAPVPRTRSTVLPHGVMLQERLWGKMEDPQKMTTFIHTTDQTDCLHPYH